MKNYYELLEVDKKASPEIIDRAYKVLAKKYHPDLQPEENKALAEEEFKIISNAYETLSDKTRRKEYDRDLANSTIDYNRMYNELLEKQKILKQELEILKRRNTSMYNNETQNRTTNPNPQVNSNNIYYKKDCNVPDVDELRNQEYNRAYSKILRNLGYSFRKKRTLKDFMALLLTILTIILIISILWWIPYTRNYLISFYENNSILKGIVDIFIH